MVPSSLGALLGVLGLIPGWLFLSRTERVRRPGPRSGLRELVELVAVGLATTGASVLIGSTLFPRAIREALAGHAGTAERFREDVWCISALLVGSMVISMVLAWIANRRRGPRYSEGVWETAFGADPGDGRLRHAVIELLDGRTIDGPLLGYTLSRSDEGPSIALGAPIFFTRKGDRRRVRYDSLVVQSEQARFAAITYADLPDPTISGLTEPIPRPTATQTHS